MNKKKTEATSSSSEEVPKTRLGLEDKYKSDNQKEVDAYERLKTKESDKLPKPTGWRMIVLPFKMPEKSRGGLYFGQDTLEKQQVASTCGLVLAQGCLLYTSPSPRDGLLSRMPSSA